MTLPEGRRHQVQRPRNQSERSRQSWSASRTQTGISAMATAPWWMRLPKIVSFGPGRLRSTSMTASRLVIVVRLLEAQDVDQRLDPPDARDEDHDGEHQADQVRHHPG